MNRFPLALAALATLTSLHADESADRQEIVSKAREMISATFKGDMTAVLRFTHPAVVKIGGGEEAMKKVIEGVATQMKQANLEFVSMDAEPPEKFFTSGSKTFAIVKTKTVMLVPGRARLTENGAMLAIRESPQAGWTFLRINEQIADNRELLQKLIPGVPDEIVLPKPAKTAIEPIGK